MPPRDIDTTRTAFAAFSEAGWPDATGLTLADTQLIHHRARDLHEKARTAAKRSPERDPSRSAAQRGSKENSLERDPSRSGDQNKTALSPIHRASGDQNKTALSPIHRGAKRSGDQTQQVKRGDPRRAPAGQTGASSPLSATLPDAAGPAGTTHQEDSPDV